MKLIVEFETKEEINEILGTLIDKPVNKELPVFDRVVDKPPIAVEDVEPQRIETMDKGSVEDKVDRKTHIFFKKKKQKDEKNVPKNKDDLMDMMFRVNEIKDKSEIEALEKIVAERKNEIKK